jgi:DNA helicase IV
MPRVEFDPKIQVFEQVKTVHALNGAATVIGHSLYPATNIIRAMKSMMVRFAGQVARMVKRIISYRVFVEKLEGTTPLGRLIRRWESNIKMYVRQIRWGLALD